MKQIKFTYSILFLLFLISVVLGSESFECYKLIMYNKNGVTLGSQKANLNFLGSSHKISFDEDLVRSKATFLPYSVRTQSVSINFLIFIILQHLEK